MLMKLISLPGSLGWRSSIDLARRDWLEARKLPTTRLTLRTDFILNRNLNYSGGKTCAILNDCAAEWFNFSPFLLWIFNDALTYFPLLRFSPLHATAKRFANLKNSNFNELHFPRTLRVRSRLGHETFRSCIGLEFRAFENCISLHVLMHLCNFNSFLLPLSSMLTASNEALTSSIAAAAAAFSRLQRFELFIGFRHRSFNMFIFDPSLPPLSV